MPDGSISNPQGRSYSSSTVRREKFKRGCSECRRRKKLCDGKVPNCSNCMARKVTNLCRWGDSRDAELNLDRRSDHSNQQQSNLELEAQRSSVSTPYEDQHTSSPYTPSSISTSDRPRLVETLAQVDLSFSINDSHHKDSLMEDTIPQESSRQPHLLTSQYATSLVGIYREHLSFGHLHELDYDVILACCEKLTTCSKDTKALILFLSASALGTIPPSLAVSLEIILSFKQVNSLVSSWTQEGLDYLKDCDFYFEPTLHMIEAVLIYTFNLVHR